MTYVPYETLSRIEADGIVQHLPSELRSLSDGQLSCMKELISHAVAVGLEMGFDLSELSDPISLIEAYNAGASEAIK